MLSQHFCFQKALQKTVDTSFCTVLTPHICTWPLGVYTISLLGEAVLIPVAFSHWWVNCVLSRHSAGTNLFGILVGKETLQEIFHVVMQNYRFSKVKYM